MSIGHLAPPSITDRIRIRACAYGDPKVGKSRWACAFPPEYGKVVLVAADHGAEDLDPVLPKYRDNVVILKPGLPDKNGKVDYLGDCYTIAKTNWEEKLGIKIGLLVWDTWSVSSKRILQEIANRGEFSGKHIEITAGTHKLAVPMEGDYGATMSAQEEIVQFALEKPYGTLFLCHTAIRSEAGVILGGGPDTVGKARILTFGGLFPNLFYLTRKAVPQGPGKPPKASYLVHTTQTGIWNAGVRSGATGDGENTMPVYELGKDPGEFWHDYVKHFITGETTK